MDSYLETRESNIVRELNYIQEEIEDLLNNRNRLDAKIEDRKKYLTELRRTLEKHLDSMSEMFENSGDF